MASISPVNNIILKCMLLVFYKKNLKRRYSCLSVCCASCKRINQFYCDGSDFFFRDYSSSKTREILCFLICVSIVCSVILMCTLSQPVS